MLPIALSLEITNLIYKITTYRSIKLYGKMMVMKNNKVAKEGTITKTGICVYLLIPKKGTITGH